MPELAYHRAAGRWIAGHQMDFAAATPWRMIGRPDSGARRSRGFTTTVTYPGYLMLTTRRFRDAIRDLARTLPTLVGGVRVERMEIASPLPDCAACLPTALAQPLTDVSS